MAETPAYTVLSTRPDVIINKQGQPVRGVTITVYLPAFDETHEVFAESLDPKVARKAIQTLVDNRTALASL